MYICSDSLYDNLSDKFFVIIITGLSTNNGVDEQGPNTVIRKPVSTLPCYPYIFKIMHLMYYLDAGGKRVYTLKVTQLWSLKFSIDFTGANDTLLRPLLHLDRKIRHQRSAQKVLTRQGSHQMTSLVDNEWRVKSDLVYIFPTCLKSHYRTQENRRNVESVE